MPAPVRAIAPATSTNLPVLSSLMSHAHSSSNGQEAQEAPLPSSSVYSGLACDRDGGIASNDFQNSQLAEETSSVGPTVENNGREIDDSEKIQRWYKDLEALAPEWFEDELDEEAMQVANTANSTDGEIAEVQTTPLTPPIPAVDRSTILNALGSVPDLQRMSPESRPEGEVNNTENEDTTSLEQWPARRTTSWTPIRFKKLNASELGPSTRSTFDMKIHF